MRLFKYTPATNWQN